MVRFLGKVHRAFGWLREHPWHPWLLAAWPLLHLAAANPGEVLPRDLWAPLGVALAATATLYALGRWALSDAARAAVLVSLAIVAWFAYADIHSLICRLNETLGVAALAGQHHAVRHRFVMGALAMLLTAATVIIIRTRRTFQPLTGPLNFAAALLVAVAVGRIGVAQWHDRGAVLVRPYFGARQDRNGAPRRQPLPDVYYVVLDRYADRRTLAENYGFDNEPFLARLRERRFYVADGSRCNFAASYLSLWTSLNMQYPPADVRRGTICRSLRDGYALSDALAPLGYRTVHVGSWYMPTRNCRRADANPGASIWRSELVGEWIELTPWHVIDQIRGGRRERDHAAIAQAQFAELLHQAHAPGPKLVVAHVLLPHPPFVFAADGTRLEKPAGEGGKAAYVEQLRYVNALVDRWLDAVLAADGPPPVVVLQADEGPYLREDDRTATSAERRDIRTGILNALYLPRVPRDALYPEITPVNTFRLVLRYEFGLPIGQLDDQVFAWGEPASDDDFPDRQHLLLRDISDELAN